MSKKSIGLALFLSGFVLAGLSAQAADNPPQIKLATPATTIHGPEPVPAPNPGFSGTVLETMNSGGYTYIQVDLGTEKKWAAAPECKVKVGDKVKIPEGAPMPGFHSKTLNRDFDVIVFAPAILNEDGTQAATAAPAAPAASGTPGASVVPASGTPKMPAGHPPISGVGKAPAQEVDVSGIKKVDGGKTISEVYAEKAALSGKEVKVRGKVVKYNAQIMGKNWFHIKDGTGEKETSDLTVTTDATVKVGDTVVVTGKLSVDKDFGAGYKYSVIVEDAKATVE